MSSCLTVTEAPPSQALAVKLMSHSVMDAEHQRALDKRDPVPNSFTTVITL